MNFTKKSTIEELQKEYNFSSSDSIAKDHIFKLFKDTKFQFTSVDVALITGIKNKTVSARINDLCNENLILLVNHVKINKRALKVFAFNFKPDELSIIKMNDHELLLQAIRNTCFDFQKVIIIDEFCRLKTYQTRQKAFNIIGQTAKKRFQFV